MHQSVEDRRSVIHARWRTLNFEHVLSIKALGANVEFIEPIGQPQAFAQLMRLWKSLVGRKQYLERGSILQVALKTDTREIDEPYRANRRNVQQRGFDKDVAPLDNMACGTVEMAI